MRVGLTGGLASGKSFVGGVLEDLACLVIRADELGHAVLEEEARDAVLREFGTLDRGKLAAEVFGKPERLARLNELVHPPVRARAARMMEEFFRREPRGIAVSEAAILIEAGSRENYDRLIVAWCRPEQQIERAMERDGLSREQVEARLARQMPLEEKKRHADYLIDTSGTKESTVEQTRAVYSSLRSLRS